MSTDPLVIAIDTSTTATKAIIVNSDGKVLATGKRDIPLKNPRTSFYEHNPLDWWTTTDAAIAEAVGQLSADEKSRIAAMGITHQRETFAPFDADGNPLRDGILWMDGRATDQILAYGTPEIHAKSGKPADITPALYKMAWVKENEPEIFPAAHKVVEVHGYVVFKLTGLWTSSVACADSLGLFDIAAQDYDSELLEIAGVTREQMADLVKPGQVIGDIKPEITRAWGLQQTVPLVAGMGDGQAAGVGAAAVSADTMYLNLGTAVVAGLHGPDYAYGKAYRTLAAGIPDWYDFELLLSSGAFLATWFREALGNPALGARVDPELEADATALPVGSLGLITMPYWNAVQTPHWDPVARGAAVGWRGIHNRPAMYRSILESIGLEMRGGLEGLEADTGNKVTQIRSMGGGNRSKLWRQIMTDAMGVPITACTEDEISALGAAVAAMSITGVHGEPDIAAYAEKMAQFGDTTEPNQENSEIYGELLEIQRKIYPALKDINNDINAFMKRHPG
ncbi:MAG TPA: FGGY family carbohydrate kinase [Micropruina sp.]|nr:FGGY family carbohydrate kinase [Micropruina sp.]